jgi:hypothetical protein
MEHLEKAYVREAITSDEFRFFPSFPSFLLASACLSISFCSLVLASSSSVIPRPAVS